MLDSIISTPTIRYPLAKAEALATELNALEGDSGLTWTVEDIGDTNGEPTAVVACREADGYLAGHAFF